MKKDNWKVVVLAVVGATTFWLFTALNKSYDTRINYPIEFEFDRDSLVVVSPLAEEVRIDVHGGGWNLLRKTFWLNSSPIRVTLDNPTETKYLSKPGLLPLISDQIGALRLNYVVTDTLFVDIDEKVTRRFNIGIDSLDIPLEENHRLVSEIKIEPDSIELTGSKKLLNEMENVIWCRFDEDKINENYSGSVALDLPHNAPVASSIEEATVSFNVKKFVRKIVQVPYDRLNFSPDNHAIDSTLMLSFTIVEDSAATVTATDFGVVVDYATYNPQDSTVLPVILFFPDGISDLQLLPKKLKVETLML